MKLTIEIIDDFFAVSGHSDELLRNKRLVLSLKRLNYNEKDGVLLIPYKEETKIKTLEEIQEIFQKNGYEIDHGNTTNRALSSYTREVENFRIFSEKAKSIRDNGFNENQMLVSMFEEFQRILKSKLIRRLYPLQLLSSFHMAFAQNSCNFAVPGAGKTSIVYGAYAYLNSLPENNPRYVDKLIVIGPISSFAPWENEYFECFGRMPNSFRMSGNRDLTLDDKLEHFYSSRPPELTLIFHGAVDRFQRDIIDFLKRNKTMVVVDEAHRIKNPEGVWGKSVTEISKEAISRIALTGTPVPNGYQDLYNIYKFIYPYKYKDILRFHYHNLEEMNKEYSKFNSKVLDLKRNIAPYYIRIKKSDLDLPPISEVVLEVEMESLQREIYDFIEAKYIENFKINSSATVKDVLNRAKLIRLRQAATNPSLLSQTLKNALEGNILTGEYDPNSVFTTINEEFINDSEFFSKIIKYDSYETPIKFKTLLSLLENEILYGNEKVIIWTIFIQNAKKLSLYLNKNGIKTELLIGEIPQPDREETINAFNDPNNSEFNVIIANPFSVAESISLHKGCHNAIYLERDYNCSNFLQSKDRIHRVGLKRDQLTRYFYIVSKDSIDEVINNRLRIKIERMEEVINDDIPLFQRIDDNDETDIISSLIADYARRT